MTPAVGQRADAAPSRSRARAGPPRCARRARARAAARAVLVELHRHGRQSVRRTALDHRPRRGSRWRAPAGRRAAPRRPASAPTARRCARAIAFHSSNVRLAKIASQLGDARGGVGSRRAAQVDEARIVGQVGAADRAGRTRPSTGRLAGTSAGCGGRPSCGRWPTSGFTQRRRGRERRWASPPLSAASRSDDSVHIAVASSETSTTDPLPVRVRLSSAAGDPERQRHRAVAVAHRAALADRVVHARRG